MKLFKYDPKTKIFEYRLRDGLDENHLKILLAFKDHKCLDWTLIEELFANEGENAAQAKTNSTFHLSQLGLIEYDDKTISDGWNTEARKPINERKVSGYFLTTMGKSFVNSLLSKDKRNKSDNGI